MPPAGTFTGLKQIGGDGSKERESARFMRKPISWRSVSGAESILGFRRRVRPSLLLGLCFGAGPQFPVGRAWAERAWWIGSGGVLPGASQFF